MKKLTTEEFIEKARKVHGDKYDYSKVEYVNNITKVCMACKEHGEFWQTPTNHLKGKGCPKCVGMGKSTQDIIKEFQSVHGDKYDYSKVNYKGKNKKVIIICPKHGEFEMTPAHHLEGCCCGKCKGKHRTTESFIEECKEIWGDVYDLSKIIYVSAKKPILVGCRIHGFQKIPRWCF